jgi:flagellar hook-associated protein 3 FlgL
VRITNQLIQRSSITTLQNSLQGLDKARAEVSTGLRVRRMSDDPAAASEVVRSSSQLRAIEQYRRNIRIGEGKAGAEENVLDQLSTTLARAGELALREGSTTSTAQTRAITKAEVDQIIDHAVGLANTRFGTDFLFGGTRGNEAPIRNPPGATDPFTNLVDGASLPVNPSGSIDVEIGDGHFVSPNHNATEIFLDTNALQSLRDLSIALGSGDAAGMNTAMGAIEAANDKLQAVIGSQGSRSSEFITGTTQLNALSATVTLYRSDLREVEVEEAFVELSSRQTGYQAAMTATSRVLGLSLANYL